MVAVTVARLIRFTKSRFMLALSIVLLLVFVIFASASTLRNPDRGPRDGNWERIQSNGYLIVGVDPNIPPFAEDTPSGPVGFDPAIAQEIGRRLGLEVRFIVLSYDGLYDTLLLNYADVVIAALRPDPLRADRVRYTPPYFDAGHIIVSLEPLNTLDELRNKTAAVEFASEGDIALRQLEDVTIQRYFTAAEAIDAVLRGEADAALVDRVSAYVFRGDHAADSLYFSPRALVPDPYVIAVRRTDWRLYQAVENAVLGMQADGTLDALRETWLTQP